MQKAKGERQWSVVGGQWSVVSGQLNTLICKRFRNYKVNDHALAGTLQHEKDGCFHDNSRLLLERLALLPSPRASRLRVPLALPRAAHQPGIQAMDCKKNWEYKTTLLHPNADGSEQ
jgi:hypothetical protein